MKESILSYNLSRPYPFRWFTWFVFVGGIIATVLFTVINLAANGYNSKVVFLRDLNSTILEKRWFERQPWSLASQLSTSCQPQLLNVGSADAPAAAVITYTNASLFGYSLTGVWSYTDSSSQRYWAYLNNVLEDCSLYSVTVNLVQNTDPDSGGSSISANTQASCNVTTADFVAQVTLQSTIYSVDAVESAKAPAGSAPWWAAQLVYNYESMIAGYLDLMKGTSESNHSVQLSCPSFGLNNVIDTTCTSPTIIPYEPLVPTALYNKLINGYGVAVITAYATDLGIKGKCCNVLHDLSDFLQFFNETNSLYVQVMGPTVPSMFHEISTGLGRTDDPPLDNATAFFEYYNSSIPVVEPATLIGQYLCQVPVLRPAGSLFVSILIADVVLLQALWQLVQLVATSFLERRKPESRFCLGCSRPKAHGDDEPQCTKLAGQSDQSAPGGLSVKLTSSEMNEDNEDEARKRVSTEDLQKGLVQATIAGVEEL